MRLLIIKFRTLCAATVLLAAFATTTASAQESSVNTYSPYTMYGLGALTGGSGVSFAGMGGAEIGYRNGGFDTPAEVRLNVSNPAALSGVVPRNFILDVGMQGSNIYLGEQSKVYGRLKSSFNTFNINNISAVFPIARKLGAAIHVLPFSQVGYRIHENDHSQVADLGQVRYVYMGEGDINEAKISLGWEPFKNFSIGAEMIYMWGNVDRTYQEIFWNITGPRTISGSAVANTSENISRVFGAFGLQYSPLDKAKSRLTIGATYRMGGKLGAKVTDAIPSGNIHGDMVRSKSFTSPVQMAQRVGAGLFYHRPKWAVGLDYVFQDWGRNGSDAANNVQWVNTHAVKIGAQYTPNRYDIRGKGASFFNRVTYKVGGRWGNHYMTFNGTPVNETAVTVGLDIPFSAMMVSRVSVGVELGQRGTLRNNLPRERYFKVTLGVMLFGKDYDYWFEKYKYN